jgi:CubicO group peptidase (beta-lactamase class C family)
MRPYLSVGLALVLAAQPAAAQETVGLDSMLFKEFMKDTLEKFRAPGAAVVVVQEGKVSAMGYGLRRQGALDPVTADTVFPIASCSKPFTAALLAQLVHEKKLSWDDRVADHLPLFRLSDPLADREVTFRDLLSHRTGMPRHDLLWIAGTTKTDDLFARWGRAKPSTSFRSTWEYSNVPFTAAGYVAGTLNHTDWAGAVKKRLFDPLKMTRSSATAKEGQKGDHAIPHYLGLNSVVDPVAWDAIDHAGGAGCVNSTANDMGKWVQAQLDGGQGVIPAAELAETHRRQMIVNPTGSFVPYFPPPYTKNVSYGLGWFVHDYRGHTCVSHGGTLTGIRAQCMMVPEKKVGVFVVCNLRPSLLPEAVAKTVLDKMLGVKAEDAVNWVEGHLATFTKQEEAARNVGAERAKKAVANTKPSLPLTGYAGGYAERAYGRASVKAAEKDKDVKLTLEWGGITYQLDHYHFDTFTAKAVAPAERAVAFERSPTVAHFRLGSDGRVESLTFHDQVFRREP